MANLRLGLQRLLLLLYFLKLLEVLVVVVLRARLARVGLACRLLALLFVALVLIVAVVVVVVVVVGAERLDLLGFFDTRQLDFVFGGRFGLLSLRFGLGVFVGLFGRSFLSGRGRLVELVGGNIGAVLVVRVARRIAAAFWHLVAEVHVLVLQVEVLFVEEHAQVASLQVDDQRDQGANGDRLLVLVVDD